jgi:diguanylate cyclase (GGDEF)-like protein
MFLLMGGLLLVGLVGLFDYLTGPHLSFSLFYLIPVVACAWWGGYPHGIFVALAGAVVWHCVDLLEDPSLPAAAGVWNGVVRFGTLVLASSVVARLHAGVLRERRLARTDPLTGAANARTFYEAVAAEAERACRASQPLTLAYLDLDDFKQLNDRLGHAAGDKALLHVVQTIHLHLGGTGLLARLGGDEFALLLPGLGAKGAEEFLARLQELLADAMASCGWPVSMSVGAITFLRPLFDVDQMIQRVDVLMYGAKRKGKGRVEHAVVRDGSLPAEPFAGVERRATARVVCDRAARIRCGGQETDEELATLRDISVSGVGLSTERAFPPGTILVIEPLSPGARTLLARVVRVISEGAGWVHGCVVSPSLTEEELRHWLGVLPPSSARSDLKEVSAVPPLPPVACQTT